MMDAKKVEEVDESDTEDFMIRRIRRQVGVARGWHTRLLLALRNDDNADCHPDAARWQRNAYMARARRIRNEFEQARIGAPA